MFMGYGQVWRYKAHEETARQRVLTDPHSPPEFRIDGAVRKLELVRVGNGVHAADAAAQQQKLRELRQRLTEIAPSAAPAR